MLHPPVTIPIAFVHGMLSGVRARGLPVEDYLAASGIAVELLQEVSARVTTDQYVTLWRVLTEDLDDEVIGFLSRPLRRGSYALMARSALGARTLEVALRHVAHTFRLLQDDAVLVPARDGDLAGVALRFSKPRAARPAFVDELLLRVFWRLLAWVAGGRLPVARFDFAFESPTYAGSYGKVFPAPLQFGQEASAFWFDATLLACPVRRDAAALRTFLADGLLNVIMPARNEDAVSTRVRRHLERSQPAWPDLVSTAEALHMAASTLQRRLAVDGTSFQALKDELRRDLAIVRLNTTEVPLAVLAAELGFADNATFNRAFKAWTGSAPGAYRRSGT